jgi:type IV pilus assembly protein PilC
MSYLKKSKKEKPKKLTQFKYVVKASNGEKIKGVFDAETQDDVRIFLVNGGYEIVSIAPVSKLELNINIGSNKIKNNDLAFMLTQLSTYVKAGIPLIDSVRILSKQTTKANYRRILDKVVYELIMGEKFSSALEKQGNVFPKLLINMVKTSEMTGDLSGTLDEMADYYTEMEKTRKQMISAMVYPAVILVLAIAAIIFIVVTVVPQFIEMFRSNNAKLPGITLFIINASNFLTQKWYIIAIILLVVLIVYRTLYKNVKGFRKAMQTIFMKTPVIGNVIIYNEVANFTRTFASLLNHNVFITDSMEILSTISDNEIYKDIISRTLIGLSKGDKISETFKGEWAFPIIAYEMLVTGENTGQLALMMEKVADYYQELHKNAVSMIKSLVEPVIICLLAVAVGFIMLSIIIPMFDLYQQM